MGTFHAIFIAHLLATQLIFHGPSKDLFNIHGFHFTSKDWGFLCQIGEFCQVCSQVVSQNWKEIDGFNNQGWG